MILKSKNWQIQNIFIYHDKFYFIFLLLKYLHTQRQKKWKFFENLPFETK